MNAKTESALYTREEILERLAAENLSLEKLYFRKAVRLGLIPSPRHVSTGKRSLRPAYSETALAIARVIAKAHSDGLSLNKLKPIIEAVTVSKMHDTLNLLESLVRIHPRTPGTISSCATLMFKEVAKTNTVDKPGVQPWLSAVIEKSAGFARIPAGNALDTWTSWLAQLRSELEERNRKLRANLKMPGAAPSERRSNQ